MKQRTGLFATSLEKSENYIIGYFTFINNKAPFSITGIRIFLHSPTLKNRLYRF